MKKLPTLEEFFVAHGIVTNCPRTVMPFHRHIFNHLTQWVAGMLPDGKRNLAICMPPRHGKTYIARDCVAWGLACWPDSEWIYTSYSARLAVEQTMAIKETVSSDWYMKAFPYVGVEPGKGRQERFTTPSGGSVYGVGIGGTITGFGAGKKRPEFGGGIVIDDPLQAIDAYSEAKRDGCNRWYSQTLYSRRNSSHTPVLLIMQRLHEQDLVGYLLEREPELWSVLQVPVKDDNGAMLWPETFSEADAERLESYDPFAYYAQYMQTPTPAGGAMVKQEMLRRYELPSPTLSRIGIFADTAMKEGQRNDFSVLLCAGTDGNDVYVLDIDRGKWTAPDLLDHAIEFWNRHRRVRGGPRFSGFYIEDKASGTGLIQTLRAQTSIPVIAVQRDRDKVSRLNDVLPWIAGNRLCIPTGVEWAEPLISELCSFSPAMTHAHDDQVDTVVDALSTLLGIGGGMSRGMDLS